MPEYQVSDLTVNVDFECHIDGDKDKDKVSYRAKVEFESLAWLLECGGESVTRTLQTWARKGKFPEGERVLVKVGEKVEFSKPVTKSDLDRMSDDDALKTYEMLKARFEAQQKDKAEAMAEAAQDEPKTKKVKSKA